MYFITSKSLPRRTLLRGVGTALALPFLDAMSPATFSLRAQSMAKKPVRRFQAMYVPNGMAMPHWTPKAVGKDFEITPILESLAPFRDQMLVLSGINANWVNIHNGAAVQFLTGVTHGAQSKGELLADVSIDQMLAREFGKKTQLASLEMATEGLASAGSCTGGLNCSYLSTLAWRTPTQPLPMETNPRTVFERLFGDTGSTERSAREERLHHQKSILDSVNGKLSSLRQSIGAEDRLQLDQYTDAVRDVERRIQTAEQQIGIDLPDIKQPAGIPANYEDHVDLMFDLQLLAFQTDLTRVSTFMFARELSGRPYPQIGVPEAHHPLSHHNDRPDLVARMSKINTYHVQLFSKYVTKLRATREGDGTLLDSVIILYGTGLSNSTWHTGVNLPLLLVGGGAGNLKGGRHITYTDEPSMANLLVALMDKFDVPVQHIGGSTGELKLDMVSI
jgi:Protein of unknown function (DUF1552)